MALLLIPSVKPSRARRSGGFSLIEVLVTILVLVSGLVGLAAMLGKAYTSESEAYQRGQAVAYLNDIVDRISANRVTAPCFVQNLGVGETPVACTGVTATADVLAIADATIADFQNMLLGTSAVKGATNVGGISDARVCITQSDVDIVLDATTVPITTKKEDLYYVAIAWQGQSETVAPAAPTGAPAPLVTAIACGTGDYGSTESLRRLIWTSVRIADLL